GSDLTPDGEAAVGTLTRERGELVARERDVLLELGDALARRGDRSLRLLELDLGVEARGEPLPREIVDRLALRERRLRHVELIVGAAELGVGMGDRGRQEQAGGEGVYPPA